MGIRKHEKYMGDDGLYTLSRLHLGIYGEQWRLGVRGSLCGDTYV